MAPRRNADREADGSACPDEEAPAAVAALPVPPFGAVRTGYRRRGGAHGRRESGCLVVPGCTEAGLHVIPWDRLREKSPRLFNLCRRSGASNLHSLRDGGTLYVSDWSGVHWHEENLEVEEVMETPEVGPGDLLLLSFNTIHATQTTDDRRLAVTLRTCDPESCARNSYAASLGCASSSGGGHRVPGKVQAVAPISFSVLRNRFRANLSYAPWRGCTKPGTLTWRATRWGRSGLR